MNNLPAREDARGHTTYPCCIAVERVCISYDEHFHQNPDVTTETLCKGLLEVKQTSPSFDHFADHQAGRRGSQLIVGA